MNPRLVAILCLLSAAATFAVAIFGPRLLDRHPKQRFAAVDLSALIRKNQERGLRLLADPTTSDSMKKEAIAMSAEFGKRADAEVSNLSRDCACILLMREAVVAGDIEDLTPVLAKRLGVQ